MCTDVCRALAVQKNWASIRTAQAICAKIICIHSNGSGYPCKKNLHPFPQLGLSVRKKLHPFERLGLSVRKKVSSVEKNCHPFERLE